MRSPVCGVKSGCFGIENNTHACRTAPYLFDYILHLSSRLFKRIGTYHIGGASDFVGGGHLLFLDSEELRSCHGTTCQNPRLLRNVVGIDASSGIHPRITAGLEQKWDIEDDDICLRRREKSGSVLTDERVNDPLDLLQRGGIPPDDLL